MTLTAQGFIRKRYDDYITEMEQQARELFGADVNLSDNSPLGQFIKLIAYARAEENELAEAVYNSAFVDTAEGVSLDRVCKYIGITRLQAQKAVGPGALKITVDEGATVEAGLIVSTQGGIEFITTETVTDTDNDGIVYADIEAVEAGAAGNVPANTITEIVTPVAGVQSVTNEIATSGGRDTETDAELRSRYYLSVAKSGSSTTDGIRAALLNDVPGVRAVTVIENNNDTTDADGRPPHSFEVIVLGGNPQDIAEAILSKKPAGIRAYGSQTVVVQDASGNNQTIGFSTATQKNIHANVTITKNNAFPTDGVNMVKLEIVKYIGGQDASGNSYTGLGMGEDVIYAKVINAILSVPGIDDVTVTLSDDGTNFSTSNVVIAPTEVAQTDFDKLVINVV
jgi:uncharacterized phage protein gp47/JayE